MPDQVGISLRIGSWMDEADGQALAPVGEVALSPSVGAIEDFIAGTLSTLREADLNPWAHRFAESAYYANAGGSSWSLAVDIAPFFNALLDIETARAIGGAFLGALFGRMLMRPEKADPLSNKLDGQTASARVSEYMVRRDDLAPSQVREIALRQLEDESFEVIVCRETDGHRFVFRLSCDGLIVARVDLDELINYSKRRRLPGEGDAE